MGIRNKDGALFMATGVDNSGLYAGRREAIGIIKAMSSQITSFDVFGGLGISAATAFASAAKSSYDFEKEFRKNMLEVATISTQVTNDMTGFMNQVMAITQEIPIKAPDAAKALYQIVSAGHDGASGMNVLEVSARSAIGGMTDTATAADAITTLLNAYKLSADDAEKVSDQLFTTARLGKTTFGELGQSIAQVAPIAAAYGVEMDQVLAAVATLTKSGTPTAQAMTQIRASIIAASKELGDGAFNTYTFQEALAEVANRAGGSESKLRELIPEVEAVNGVLGMTGIKAQDAADHLNAMNDSAGATEVAFKQMMGDVDKQMILLSNNIQAALRPMGQTILKNVSEAAKAINQGFETGDIQNSMENLKKLLLGVAGAYVTYKSSAIGASSAEAFHSAKVSISNNIKILQNKISGESIIAKERERLYQEAYNASLEKTITEEQRAKLSKMNLKAGSEEYIKALTDQAMQEKKNADNLVESLTKQVETNKVKLASAKDNLDISQKSVGAAKTEFDAAFAANDLAALEVAQTKMNAAAKREEAAATNVSTSAKKLKSTESKLLIASTNAENATTRINTATTVADTAVTNVATGAKNRLKVATVALWGVMKANPLGAILTMISFATTAYMIFADKIKETETTQSRLNKLQMATADNMANEQAELRLLLSIAKNELVSKGEREKAIKKLNDISPEYLGNLTLENLKTQEATDSIDAYTEAIEKNAKMKAAQDMVADKYKQQLDYERQITDLKLKREKANDRSAMASTQYGQVIINTNSKELIDNDIKKLQREKEQIQKDIDQILSFAQDQVEKKTISIPVDVQLKSEQSYLKTLFDKKAEIDARINGKKEKGLFVDALDVAELAAVNKELTNTNEKIISLNKNVADAEKKESSSIANEIKVATEKVSTLKQELTDLRSGKTKAEVGKTVQQTIEEKTKELKVAEDALSTLTGKDKSSLKEASDLLKLQQNLSRSILDSELKLQVGRIAAMEDGKAKRMALAKQEYDEARAQIDKDEQDLLSKKGITKDQKKIVSDNANSLRLQEQQNLLKKNTDIEKSSAKEIQSIWADVNSRFSSGLENRLTEIDKFYEEAIKKAREEGVEEIKIAELISKAKEEKASVKNESFIEEGMQRIAMEEEVAQKHLEIKQDQFVTDSVYQLKRNSLERKFTLDRLNLLKKSIAQEGTERYRQIENEKKQLSGHLTYLDEYGETLKSEVIQDALSGLSDITDAIGGLNDDLGETMQQVQQLIGAVAQLASGNYIGAAVSVITSVVSSIAKHNADVVAYNKNIEAGYWDAVNWKIERQIQLMKELDGINSDQVGQSIDEQINELMDKLSGVDLNVKMGNLQAFFDNVGNGISSANKKGNEFAVNFLKGLFDAFEDDNKSGVNGHWNFRFYDILKDLSKDEVISLQGIPEIWAILPEEIQNYIKQLSDAVDKQKELTETTKEMFTGTTEDDIVQSILDAMSRGKDGVDDLTTYFKDMMKKAMLEGVKMNYLQKPIKDFYKQFSAMSESDGMLTEGEIKQLEGLYQQIIDNAQSQFDNLQKISGLDFSTPEEGESDNTLKGAYAKASQESIDLLAGQTGASRVVLEDIRNNMQPIREQMKLIYDMQVRGWEDVKAIRDLSDKVEKNTNRIAENTQEIKTVADKISDNTKRTVETLEGRIDVNIKGM